QRSAAQRKSTSWRNWGVRAPIAKYNAQNAAQASTAGGKTVEAAKSTEDARHIRRGAYYDRFRMAPIRDPGNSGLQAMEMPGITHGTQGCQPFPRHSP